MKKSRADMRGSTRAPVPLHVRYRTAGSFLVSYTQNLSRGGLFLETADLFPVGTNLVVQFTIPGQDEPIEIDAVVKWLKQAQHAGEVSGVGLAFGQLDEHLGQQIDRLIHQFVGLELLAAAGGEPALQRLQRNLRSLLNCEVHGATSASAALAQLAPSLDLVVLDLDTLGKQGIEAVRAAASCEPPVPVLTLSREPERNRQASVAGANASLPNPPAHDRLRSSVLELLGKPANTR